MINHWRASSGNSRNMRPSFCDQLARIAEERTSYNLLSTSRGAGAYAKGSGDRRHLVETPEMLERARQLLRYEVYCGELGRHSPYADHDRKIIADELDAFGNTFVAAENGEIIGTLRSNVAADGPLGILEDLYGMRASGHHPHATGMSARSSSSGNRSAAAPQRFGLSRRRGPVRPQPECEGVLY